MKRGVFVGAVVLLAAAAFLLVLIGMSIAVAPARAG